MIRLKDIKIREDLTEEQVFQKAILKNKIKYEEVEKWKTNRRKNKRYRRIYKKQRIVQ